MSQNGRPFEIISDVLVKLIDMQKSTTEALTSMQETSKESSRSLKDINSHFTNGFKSDIKKHISDHSEKNIEAIQHLSEDLNKFDEQFTNLALAINNLNNTIQNTSSFWYNAKLILSVLGGVAGMIAGIVYLVTSLTQANVH
jgi:DNA replication protein DnaD